MRKHYSATCMQAHHQTRLALSSTDFQQHPCVIHLSDHAPHLMCAFTIRYCACFHFVWLGQCADFVWVICCRCGGTPSLVLSWFLCLIFHLYLRSGVCVFHLDKYGSDIFPNRRPTLTYSIMTRLSYSYSHFHPEMFHISIFNIDYLFHYFSDIELVI